MKTRQADITYHQSPSKPRLSLPAGACDTHCHVFGPVAQFPYAEDARFRPGDAPKDRLFALHDMLGIDRRVLVQPGCHGYDNSAIADAIAARPRSSLGIALLPVDVSSAVIKDLAQKGFCGVRFSYMAHLKKGPNKEDLVTMSRRLVEFGWQLVIHMDHSYIADMAETLCNLPLPVIVDHMGRIDASVGMNQAPFKALLKLMESPHVWVKVSAAERASRQNPPYADAVPFARKLVESFPDRVLWGTDWPHPNYRSAPPDDGVLVDLLADICPTEKHSTDLLVNNPSALYHFDQERKGQD